MRFERLDFADRWLSDGFRVLQENPAGFVCTLDVEMTAARTLMQRMRAIGLPGSYAGLLVRAGGLALSRQPEMHAVLSGSRRMRPDHVSVGLSVSGEAAAAPVMRLESVEEKSVVAVCNEIAERAPIVRADDRRVLGQLRRWGWLLPTGWLRRFIIRRLLSSLRFRRLFGSLQVTVVSGLDMVAPLAYGAPAVLGMGRIAERVVVRDGQPAVRLMATLSYTGDHKLWNGERVVKMMSEVQRILESGDLAAEVEVTATADVPRAAESGVRSLTDSATPPPAPRANQR
jgi:pyruvate dehydrogenase E2 component (dihydrolipoamide acetyltransferase)